MGSRRGEWVAENRSLAGHGMDAKGIPNSYGYDANGDLLPYANHRPSYRPGQVEDVWTPSREELAPRLREGGDLADLPPLRHENEMWVQVRDDSGAEDIVNLGKDRGKWCRIEWYPGQSRLDVWDMGHIPNQKYAAMHDRYVRGQMATEEFLEEYRDESNYRVEDPPRNRSHVDEKRRVSG